MKSYQIWTYHILHIRFLYRPRHSSDPPPRSPLAEILSSSTWKVPRQSSSLEGNISAHPQRDQSFEVLGFTDVAASFRMPTSPVTPDGAWALFIWYLCTSDQWNTWRCMRFSPTLGKVSSQLIIAKEISPSSARSVTPKKQQDKRQRTCVWYTWIWDAFG